MMVIVLCAAATALTACGVTTEYTATNRPPRQRVPRPPHTVEIFTSSMPEQPFVEIGILQSTEDHPDVADMPEIIHSMRDRAAQAGCDAVIINGANNSTVGSGYAVGSGKNVQAYASSGTKRGYWGACIMYRDAPPSSSAAR
jgi:hypothetical protein